MIKFTHTDAIFPIPHDKNLSQLIEEQCIAHPDWTALITNGKAGSESLTYQELNDKAKGVANYIIEKQSINFNKFIGVLMERSLDLLPVLLGILKSGATYVPIDPRCPKNRIGAIIRDAEISLVITTTKFVPILTDLQWLCPKFNSYLCVDLQEDSYSEIESAILENKILWEYFGEKSDDTASASGFLSSYTGEAFSDLEIHEISSNVYHKLKTFLSKDINVLEIGCANGITMFEIAPHVSKYLGTDLSEIIIKKNKKRCLEEKHFNIDLECLPAHKIDQIQESNFGVIIINSVVQYFPNYSYLKDVLQKALKKIAQSGILFVCDIMDLDLKNELINSLLEFKQNNPSYKTKIQFDTELFVSKEFFEDFCADFPEVCEVSFSKKLHTVKNELTQYRYDVMIKVNRLESRPSKFKKCKFNDGLEVLQSYSSQKSISISSQISPQDIAYMIYTSGSSGAPKGVMVSHQNVINFAWGMKQTINFSDHKRILSATTVSFDIFVLESWVPLLFGMTILLANETEQEDPSALANLIIKHKVSILQLTPSRLKLLASDESNLKKLSLLTELIVGGEAFPVELFSALKSQLSAKIYNIYGPTETTVWSSLREVIDEAHANIGYPIANTRLYIVDHNNNNQPINVPGVPGELWIGGEGVAAGYWNKADLNKDKFIQDPYFPKSRLYKTGDLAKWREDNSIDLIGRIDDQVKILGYRIELKEIELSLQQYPAIKQAVVVDIKENDRHFLVAYYVLKSDILENEIPTDQLRGFLARSLPEYIIPSFFVALDKIPLTYSGKVDKKSLPKYSSFTKARDNESSLSENNVEKIIRVVWENSIGINNIGIHDDFFASGGNSFLFIRVHQQLQEILKKEIPLAYMFEYPTINSLAIQLQNLDLVNSELASILVPS
ncbi:MAG: AMP-binding protein [Parachlamydiaceae bacterium]|nr:AMP-binding protein [Parachlamydiaceae bacterium]